MYIVLLGQLLRVLPIVKYRMNYCFFFFDCIEYGKWESSDNTSAEIRITYLMHFRKGKYTFYRYLDTVQEFKTKTPLLLFIHSNANSTSSLALCV